eukprot:PhF_6_TR43168/c0_g1_i1/m.66117
MRVKNFTTVVFLVLCGLFFLSSLTNDAFVVAPTSNHEGGEGGAVFQNNHNNEVALEHSGGDQEILDNGNGNHNNDDDIPQPSPPPPDATEDIDPETTLGPARFSVPASQDSIKIPCEGYRSISVGRQSQTATCKLQVIKTDPMIEKISSEGYYQKETTFELLQALGTVAKMVKRPPVFMDIGSNIGYF